jgi:PilZ domain
VPDAERRRSRRFPLKQPAIIRYEKQGIQAEINGLTENASLTGVLLVTDAPIPDTAWVQVTIVLQRPDFPAAIRLEASGQVTRVEDMHDKFSAAINYDQPLAQA